MYTHILSSHSHFNILVTNKGDVVEFSHQNLNYTPGSWRRETWRRQDEPTDQTM